MFFTFPEFVGPSNIKNKEHVSFEDQKARDSLQCHYCKLIPICLYQSTCGKICHIDCHTDNCSDVDCDLFLDNRLENKKESLLIRCQLEDEGCEWIGKCIDYEEHLEDTCEFSENTKFTSWIARQVE